MNLLLAHMCRNCKDNNKCNRNKYRNQNVGARDAELVIK